MESFFKKVNLKLEILEKMFYESKPFLYAMVATYALAHSENSTLLVSGLVLAFCSVAVVSLRVHHRSLALVRKD